MASAYKINWISCSICASENNNETTCQKDSRLSEDKCSEDILHVFVRTSLTFQTGIG
jgi:hypothetical protein